MKPRRLRDWERHLILKPGEEAQIEADVLRDVRRSQRWAIAYRGWMALVSFLGVAAWLAFYGYREWRIWFR